MVVWSKSRFLSKKYICDEYLIFSRIPYELWKSNKEIIEKDVLIDDLFQFRECYGQKRDFFFQK